MSDIQRDREERQHVIEVLKSWDGYFIGYTSDEVQEALRYAIASIETDLKYDLLYEETSEQADKPTTKNDLVAIHTEGLDEEIRCAMCTNSIKSDRGCDGSCVVNNAMYKEVMDVIENHIVDTDKMVEPTTKNDLGVDCIDRRKLIDWINIWDITPIIKNPLIRHIQCMSSVTPQEPKTGHWIAHEVRLPDRTILNYRCSVCGRKLIGYSTETLSEAPYCHCGARMVESQESEDNGNVD